MSQDLKKILELGTYRNFQTNPHCITLYEWDVMIDSVDTRFIIGLYLWPRI